MLILFLPYILSALNNRQGQKETPATFATGVFLGENIILPRLGNRFETIFSFFYARKPLIGIAAFKHKTCLY